MELSNKQTEQHGVKEDIITMTTFPSGDQHVYINTDIDEVNDDHNYEQLQRNESKKKGGVIFQQLKKRTVLVLIAVVILLVLAVIGLSVAFTLTKKNDQAACDISPLTRNGILVNVSNVKPGDVAKLECLNIKNKLVGDSQITCLSSGSWSFVPSCETKRCAALSPLPNATILYGFNSSDVGHTIELICNEGFDMIGNGTMVCLPNETWSTMPHCEPKDCGSPPNVPNAVVLRTENTKFNSTLQIQCKEGYDLINEQAVVCNKNGQWSETPSCKLITCGFPVVPDHASIRFINGTSYQDVVEVNCQEGFTLQGDNMMHCSNERKWTPIPNCTIKDCGTPPLFKHGVIKDLTTTHFNSTFIIECNEGYTASSNNVVVCGSNGQWTTIPTCNPVVCGTLVPPENGHIISINGTALGDVASVSCNVGYTLNGSQFVTCLSSSKWSYLPSCQWVANVSDCYDVQQKGKGTSDGVYNVTLWQSKRTIQVFCDLTTDGGGWTEIRMAFQCIMDHLFQHLIMTKTGTAELIALLCFMEGGGSNPAILST